MSNLQVVTGGIGALVHQGLEALGRGDLEAFRETAKVVCNRKNPDRRPVLSVISVVPGPRDASDLPQPAPDNPVLR